MLKLSENPAILTPEVQSLVELGGTWWVAHTKARFEKAFAWDMSNRGIGYFLPMREKIIFSGGRKRRVMAPLFSFLRLYLRHRAGPLHCFDNQPSVPDDRSK